MSKTILKFSLLIMIFAVIDLFVISAFASPCSEFDQKTAEFWGNYYSPEEAYKFGSYIQKLVKERNLEAIFELVDGELKSGPRRQFALLHSFDQIFDESWVQHVLAEPPECSPVGDRGFMLGNGMIWFNTTTGSGDWNIFVINNAREESSILPSGWRIDGRYLSPLCFAID